MHAVQRVPICPTSRPALSHPASPSDPHFVPTTSHSSMTDAPSTNEWERNRADGTDSTSQREAGGAGHLVGDLADVALAHRDGHGVGETFFRSLLSCSQ